MNISDMTWRQCCDLLATFGLKWDGQPDRANVVEVTSRLVVLRDVCPRTLRGYAYPPSSYRRPAYARVYDHDVAVNMQDLTVADFGELMGALGLRSRAAEARPRTIRRPGPVQR
jgi:hypothetical protein